MTQGKSSHRERVLAQVRQAIFQASNLLKPLGEEYERISWVLEDTIPLIDEIDQDENFDEKSLLLNRKVASDDELINLG